MFCLYYSKVGGQGFGRMSNNCLTESQCAHAKYVNYCAKITKKRITETKRFLTPIKLQS